MSAKSMCDKISYTQGHELFLALVRAGLTPEIAQEVINSKGNKKAKAMVAAVWQESKKDDRFQSVSSFDIIVPEDYDHATHLDAFKRERGKEFYYYNDAITDENFGKASIKITPGRKFKVEVFQITKTMSSEACLKFLAEQGAILTGAQGASLVYEQAKDKLPKGRWHVSFDKKDCLWVDSGGRHRVPFVDACSDGDFKFNHASTSSTSAISRVTGVPTTASSAFATVISSLTLRNFV